MTEYLDLEDLLEIARRAVGQDVAVRDYGLLESALARPRASVFGQDAYPDVHIKAAALFQSLARNHALMRWEQAPCVGGLSYFPGHQRPMDPRFGRPAFRTCHSGVHGRRVRHHPDRRATTRVEL